MKNYNLPEIIAWIDNYRKALPAKIKNRAPSLKNLLKIVQEVSFHAEDDYDTIPPQSPDRGWYEPYLKPEQRSAVFHYLFDIYEDSSLTERKLLVKELDNIIKTFRDTGPLTEMMLEFHYTELADELVKRNVESGAFCWPLAKKMLSDKIVVGKWTDLI